MEKGSKMGGRECKKRKHKTQAAGCHSRRDEELHSPSGGARDDENLS